MISDIHDPHRGRRGRPHDRHRCRSENEELDRSIATIVVSSSEGSAALRVAANLSRCLPATLVTWDANDDPDEADVVHAEATSAHDLRAAVIAADLLILDAEHHDWGRSKAHMLAKANGRSVLVVPAMASEVAGLKVAVIWDGTPSTARALRDALPLMRDASSICVVNVHRSICSGSPTCSAVPFIERHGFEAFEIEGEGCSLYDLVVSQTIDLVVGVSEGSAEHLARTFNVPVLISS